MASHWRQVIVDNRYLAIGFRPRSTIRGIAETASDANAIAIVAALALLNFLADRATGAPVVIALGSHRIAAFGPGTSLSTNLALALAMPIIAIVLLYLDGALTGWLGRSLGGHGKAIEMRAALAWSLIPSILGTLLYVILELSGIAHVIWPRPGETITTWMASNSKPMFAVVLATGPFAFWTMILRIVCVAELQRFSLWRAVATRAIAFLAIIAAAVSIAYVVQTLHPSLIVV